MRTLIPGGATALLVAATLAVPAHGAVRVDGNHFSAVGLAIASQKCVDPATVPDTAAAFHVAKGPGKPPLGDRTVGWTPSTTTFGIGPEVTVASPTTTDVFRIQVRAPGGISHPYAIATYQPDGDAGVWKGTSDLGTDDSGKWHRVNASQATFVWTHYTDGVFDGSAPSDQLAPFVAAHGGDGPGATVGIIDGCDGDPFYIDAFTVGSGSGTRTFNFQGFATRTLMTVGGDVRRKVGIGLGDQVYLATTLTRKVGGAGVSGKVGYFSAPVGGKTFKKFDTRHVEGGKKVIKVVAPSHNTAYQVRYAGTTALEQSRSVVTKIFVRMDVGMTFADSSVVRGHTYTAYGRVRPGKVTNVLLQRYVNKKWQTVRKGRSNRDGSYRLSAVAQETGQRYYRVLARGGATNIDGTSRHLLLKVVKPSGGGGGGTPTPPPDDPPSGPPGPTG